MAGEDPHATVSNELHFGTNLFLCHAGRSQKQLYQHGDPKWRHVRDKDSVHPAWVQCITEENWSSSINLSSQMTMAELQLRDSRVILVFCRNSLSPAVYKDVYCQCVIMPDSQLPVEIHMSPAVYMLQWSVDMSSVFLSPALQQTLLHMPPHNAPSTI